MNINHSTRTNLFLCPKGMLGAVNFLVILKLSFRFSCTHEVIIHRTSRLTTPHSSSYLSTVFAFLKNRTSQLANVATCIGPNTGTTVLVILAQYVSLDVVIRCNIKARTHETTLLSILGAIRFIQRGYVVGKICSQV